VLEAFTRFTADAGVQNLRVLELI